MTRAELTRMKSLITESEMDSWFGIIPGEELDLLLNKARTFLGKWGKTLEQMDEQKSSENPSRHYSVEEIRFRGDDKRSGYKRHRNDSKRWTSSIANKIRHRTEKTTGKPSWIGI